MAASAGLIVLGVVAVSLLDGSHIRHTELGLAGVANPVKFKILAKDLQKAQSKLQKFLNGLEVQKAGSIRGSVPTAEMEASAIINGNGADMEKNMAEPYSKVDGSHSDPSQVASAIIKQVDKDDIDVTGKAGAMNYKKILKEASKDDPLGAAWLKGSLPNYDAEASFITKYCYLPATSPHAVDFLLAEMCQETSKKSLRTIPSSRCRSHATAGIRPQTGVVAGCWREDISQGGSRRDSRRGDQGQERH